MLQFYSRLFPYRYFFQWLNHSPSPSTSFTHREIAFTLSNDAYLRYQSFPNAEAFRKEILRLNPSRFEIGPVYSSNPKDRKIVKKSQFKPLRKELVFDIDLTDYDDVRKCCQDKMICTKCWQFITVAIKIMDTALREDFGFNHILWVYSGRRGAHAWVCDNRAQLLDDQKRRAIASYLQLNSKGKRSQIRRPLHPHIERSLDILKPRFTANILEDQNPWETFEESESLLETLPDKNLCSALRERWSQYGIRSSKLKWQDIDQAAEKGVSKSLDSRLLKESKQDIILTTMYPRLDIEVSKHLNHLLKSPFCIHPATGRVCVPIDSTKIDEFNPLAVPTVTHLLNEIDEYDTKHRSQEGTESVPSQTERIADYEKTSLAPYVRYFKRFSNQIMKEEMNEKRSRDEASLDF